VRIKRLRDDFLKNFLLYLNGSLRSPLEKLVIEPTNFCNRACFFCGAAQSIAKVHRGYMDWSLFQGLADEALKIRPLSVSLHAHGEPLLHPQISEMIIELTKRGLATEIVTNGDLLTPELSRKLLNTGLGRLVISHPSISPENWQACRNESFFPQIDERIMEAIKIWRDAGDKIALRCLVFPDKVPQKVKSVRDYLKKWLETSGVGEVEFWLYQPWPDHVLEDEIHRIHVKPKVCSVALQTLLVSWKGEISPCSFDFHGNLALGKFPDISLLDLYNSKSLRKFRRQTIRCSASRPTACKKCLVNRVPAVFANVHSNDYRKIEPSLQDQWIKKKGLECWLRLVRKN
jgi:radical SAM protein with 4Fe4S-binding SPASM domain